MKRRKMDGVQKKALMIAPSYRAPMSNKKDVQTMKEVLTKRFYFEEMNIKVLEGNQATKENILKELIEFANLCNPRDVVLLFYAGHGVYLKNSQDEGLLPTVLKGTKEGVPKEEICITGQDLRPFFEELNQKTVYCTVIFDCCYSGHLYRDANELEGLGVKQFVTESKLSPESSRSRGYTKLDRGGWLPEDKDYFFYFGACSSDQLSGENHEGGYLTLAFAKTIGKLQYLDQVTYEAFFRLVVKEFKEQGWDKVQTPQFEGVNSNTVLFGVSKVEQAEGGVEISEVTSPDKLVLNSGSMQILRAGKYFVFETSASAESIRNGSSSPDYLGTIHVKKEDIADAKAIASVYRPSLKDRREITIGCLAYLQTPEFINHDVYVSPGSDTVDEEALESLIKELKNTRMLNVFTEYDERIESNPDFLSITYQTYTSHTYWVARRRDKIVVPPIKVGRESMMAGNLARYIRFHEVLDRAKPPESDKNLLDGVVLKVFKDENWVSPSKYGTLDKAIADRLNNGTDITEVNAQDGQVIFKSYEAVSRKVKPGSGDAIIWQVKNENKDKVHFCLFLFECDGGSLVLYPKKNGQTIELPGDDTQYGVVKPFILEGGIRRMAEPDPEKDEPEIITDTLVLYASSEPINLQPFLQSALQTDPELFPRDSRGDSSDLSDLEVFLERLDPLRHGEAEEDRQTVLKYTIKKLPIFIKKQAFS